MPEMSSAVIIDHFGLTYSPHKLIQDSSNNKIVLSTVFPITITQADYKIISVFSGYTIRNKRPNYYIDLYTSILPNSILTIQITGASTYQ